MLETVGKDLLTMGGLALGCGIILGPLLIPFLRRLKFGQSIRHDGPKTHLVKAGTPTMGGFLIWGAMAIALTFWQRWTRESLLLGLVILGHALLGFLDDYIKAVYKNPDGLSARWKLIGQIGLSISFYIFLLRDAVTNIRIPLLNIAIPLGPLYPVFVVLYLAFFSNAVNFADGIDGLNGGLTAIFSFLCIIIACNQEQLDLAFFTAAMLGGILAFLVFNRHPARLFMGDTGSLGLGAALAGLALLLKQEVALFIAGIIFVIEIFSVIIQVLYFKKTKGKRFFKMAPIHHHFEMLGWSEWRVDFTFWSIAILAAFLGYALTIY